MDYTPPSLRSNPKSPSRLARMSMDSDLGSDPDPIPTFSVEFAPPAKLARPKTSIPLQELLILSPSPVRRSRIRLSDRLEPCDEPVSESFGSRRRCRSKTSLIGSPRSIHRSRRRIEAEEGGIAAADDVAKGRRKRQSGRGCRREKLGLVPSTWPCSSVNESDWIALDGIGELITDLITWKDVARSGFWFGFGSLCLLSSCFARKLSFSIFSAGSQLGLLLLGISFISNLFQRKNVKKSQKLILKEEDIVRVARVVLPIINLAISKTRRLFSGEPSVTLKVALCFLIGAEYGDHITLWRFCAFAFFASFTVPKLHSTYAPQIELKVEQFKSRILEAWQSCSHKKVIVASMATAFWNLSSIRTRILAAFLALVILRYFRRNSEAYLEEEDGREAEQEKLQQALIVAEDM